MRWFPRILAILLLLVGLGAVGAVAYDAGFSAGLAQGAVDAGATIVARYPYGGWGWGLGGFLGFLLFVIVLFGVLRLAVGGRRGRGSWGPGWGPGGPGHHGEHDRGRFGPWGDRAREVHDAWHRDQPSQPGTSPGAGTGQGLGGG